MHPLGRFAVVTRLLAIATLLLAFAAAGCGGGSDHNVEDSLFVKNMIPHHRQAALMSTMASTQASSAQVKDLAARIRDGQSPQLTALSAFASKWNEAPASGTGSAGMAGMDMGGGEQDVSTSAGMQGMASELDLNRLRSATGAQFDRVFLELMTAHHRGGIAMASSELERGKFEPAKDVARQVISAQEKEIAEMDQLLRSLPA
jgi:uncharacterized protein (DUF305 family)